MLLIYKEGFWIWVLILDEWNFQKLGFERAKDGVLLGFYDKWYDKWFGRERWGFWLILLGILVSGRFLRGWILKLVCR